MNKQLIMQAVEAVIEFNSSEKKPMEAAGLQVRKHGVWIYLTDEYNEYIVSIHSATDKDLQDFIKLLRGIKTDYAASI